MLTHFSEAQLADPNVAEADRILKSCQHYGFCTSGCPTYVLLHDENDSPRGRIDLIKEMLESDAPPKASTVAHLDKCLSCMSCMTTCAVNVDYLHLADVARVHIDTHYRRPLADRLLRNALAFVLPRPKVFALALRLARGAAPFRRALPGKLQSAVDLLPASVPAAPPTAQRYPAIGARRARVALLAGCVQPVLAPWINASTIGLLTRLGCEVVVPPAAGCCGSLTLHMGKEALAQASARANVDAWIAEMDGEGLDAIVVNASGCGSTVKDYAHLLARDAERADAAKRVASIALDISEWLVKLDPPAPPEPLRYRVAYHDACSLRNVQRVTAQPRTLLRRAGFLVNDVPEAHFCCGSAGTYNLLQPEIARDLGMRKAGHIASTAPQIVAAGNIGCLTQIAQYCDTPIVHTVELLDWAYGGPRPHALAGIELTRMPDDATPTPAPDASAPSNPHEYPVTFQRSVSPPPAPADIGLW
ncbi:glycolate oxidase subunit GlcF [Pigmentiphaga litoralis]|uniref:Glycolate oxidase iron-sulfur subunit n=1 Tax=Pigmentiphaga litoralis TaxID=516702 RepID=A0A7Y9ITM7_9BURK|nr:glycolate oxidase subunit GlcF [Pigmentiphaga litoralis]NYE23560.1 glycolate oxidase iron-sulfur subunit [Pigmentiphaga litoralis]NYE82826.1 glycolate oxidase iron-sulfur subunit [Pigmentiphaga litoralis]